jgi:hypothetical protein
MDAFNAHAWTADTLTRYAPGHATDGHVAHDMLRSVHASTLCLQMLPKKAGKAE